MNMPTLWIIIGTVLFAGGGLLVTYGWNAKTEEGKKSAMVKSVAAEWLGNLNTIHNPMFTETDEEKLSQFVVFPRMNMTAIEGAISSGLFLKEEDRLLLTRVVNIHELLTQFNLRLNLTETEMKNKPHYITLIRTTLRDGATRTQLVSKLKIFGKLLMSDYGMKESDVFFVTLEEDATLPRNPKGGPDA